MTAIVIDKNGFYVEYVSVDEQNRPLFYELQEGESLVFEDIEIALRMIKAKYVNGKWLEVAAQQEIEEYKKRLLSDTPVTTFDYRDFISSESLQEQIKTLEARIEFLEKNR